jgi:hypothetical protein
MRIFVGGSLREVADPEVCRTFVAALGRAVVEGGHVLLNGCRNPIDKEIAAAAEEWLLENKRDPKRYVISYWQRDLAPVHKYGTVRASALRDWTMSHSELRVPEQIENADVAIFVAGSDGTYLARNWPHWSRKPIVGVPRFGGAGEQIYLQELNRLRNADRSQSEEYEQLNQVGSDVSEYAKELVALSERLLVPRRVFAIMSFKKKWLEIFKLYEAVCQSHGFDAERTDESFSQERINPRIEAGISKSAFVIADVSEPSSNVFFEVGFARGGGKHVILTAEEGTTLPFDLADVPVLFWHNHEELKEGLSKRIAAFKKRQQSSETELD